VAGCWPGATAARCHADERNGRELIENCAILSTTTATTALSGGSSSSTTTTTSSVVAGATARVAVQVGATIAALASRTTLSRPRVDARFRIRQISLLVRKRSTATLPTALALRRLPSGGGGILGRVAALHGVACGFLLRVPPDDVARFAVLCGVLKEARPLPIRILAAI
jgi:hypothetical protein